MNETTFEYPAARSAREFATKTYGIEFGITYGKYIHDHLTNLVARGIYTHDEAMGTKLGSLFAGNDGD